MKEQHPALYALSLIIAHSIHAEPFRCWRNAALAVLLFPELFAAGTYDEGWIVIPRASSIEIREHGWCTSPDLGILEPSLVLVEAWEQPLFYFPGLTLAGQDLASQIAGQILPRVCHSHYGPDGMGHPGYKQSYEQAWKRARELADERQLPSTAITVQTRSTRKGFTIITEQ